MKAISCMSASDSPLDTAQAEILNVVIVDYGLGNVRSVANALEAVGSQVCISNDFSALEKADCLILPGVGAFEDGIRNLQNLGLADHLTQLVVYKQKPFLGICLGMQMIAQKSYENGVHTGLGWIDADVIRFPLDMVADGDLLKVPHVGWNDVVTNRASFLGAAPGTVQSFYFVHSYYLQCHDAADIVGVCHYGKDFPAIIQRENICATQFHPEKSQKHGLELLRRFLAYARLLRSQQVLHA